MTLIDLAHWQVATVGPHWRDLLDIDLGEPLVYDEVMDLESVLSRRRGAISAEPIPQWLLDKIAA